MLTVRIVSNLACRKVRLGISATFFWENNPQSMKNIPESHSILPASDQIQRANLPFVICCVSCPDSHTGRHPAEAPIIGSWWTGTLPGSSQFPGSMGPKSADSQSIDPTADSQSIDPTADGTEVGRSDRTGGMRRSTSNASWIKTIPQINHGLGRHFTWLSLSAY